jgi:hypothetical protein
MDTRSQVRVKEQPDRVKPRLTIVAVVCGGIIAGELPLVRAAGFDIVEVQRLKAGTVERVFARKPPTE